eukprot:CAMPEP_0195288058 /NCGR_PEP_ID=MMETSP0707-20130614/4870_1 /TAXON_ID=33640 /ORGANISM="Asterionellopsis glacialis, Strain CCMP134" /LENGTH=1303 /DNA_ID=CAMNT_0040347877 /DNA_START=24 /DNA_END=3935 /DNA_ORIENTATION=+
MPSSSSSNQKYRNDCHLQQQRRRFQTQVVPEYRGQEFETVLTERNPSQSNNKNVSRNSMNKYRYVMPPSSVASKHKREDIGSFTKGTNQATLLKSGMKVQKLDDSLSNFMASSTTKSSSSEWIDFGSFDNDQDDSDSLLYDHDDPIFSPIYHSSSTNCRKQTEKNVHHNNATASESNHHVFRSQHRHERHEEAVKQHTSKTSHKNEAQCLDRQQQQQKQISINKNANKKNESASVADIWMKMGTSSINEEAIEVSMIMENDHIMNERSPTLSGSPSNGVPILVSSSSGSSDSGYYSRTGLPRGHHLHHQNPKTSNDRDVNLLKQKQNNAETGQHRGARKNRRDASGSSNATSYWSSGGSPSSPLPEIDRTAFLPSVVRPASQSSSNYEEESNGGSSTSSRYSRFSRMLLTKRSGGGGERNPSSKNMKFSTSSFLPTWTAPYLSCVEDTTNASTAVYDDKYDVQNHTQISWLDPAPTTTNTRSGTSTNAYGTENIHTTRTTKKTKEANATATTSKTSASSRNNDTTTSSFHYASCCSQHKNHHRGGLTAGGTLTVNTSCTSNRQYRHEPQQHRSQVDGSVRIGQGNRYPKQQQQQQQRSASFLQAFSQRRSSNNNNGHQRQACQNYFGRTKNNNRLGAFGKMSQSDEENSAESVWREAKDPKSGRIYFYNVKTRETQWRKPTELCSEEEKEEMRIKEQKQKDFFASMEANMLKTLAAASAPVASKGEGEDNEVDAPTKRKSFKSTTLRRTSKLTRPGMVRTISGMDENVLLELTRVPSAAGLTPKPSIRRSGSGSRTLGRRDDEDGDGAKTPDTSNVHKISSEETGSADKRRQRESLSLEEIVPMETLRESRAWGDELNMSQAGDFMSSVSNFDESFNFDGEQSISSGLDTWCSTEEVDALRELSKVTKEMKSQSHDSMNQSSPANLVLEDSVTDGLSYLDAGEGSLGDSISNFLDFEASSGNSLDMKKAEEKEKDREKTEAKKVKITTPAGDKKKEKLMARPQLAKRNTCGTLYVSNTMSAPDKDATIRCVCGVFRAHILQSVKEEENNFLGPSLETSKYRKFNDFADQRTPLTVEEDDVELTIESLTMEERTLPSPQVIPSLDEITRFYRDVFQRSQMETDCIIMSLIYVERLIKITTGNLRPNVRNWRSILMSCMVLSSKVWDDLSMWNADFTKICPAGMKFTLERINELEIAVLNALHYSVKVPSSEYAKYYFLMRSMIIKSGLSAGSKDIISNTPLDVEGAKKLEQVSSSFQVQLKKPRRPLPKKAKSLDSGSKAELKAVLSAEGRTQQRASLEHMVNM